MLVDGLVPGVEGDILLDLVVEVDVIGLVVDGLVPVVEGDI